MNFINRFLYLSKTIISYRFVTIEWANCTGELDEIPDLLAIEPHEDKPRRAWVDKDKDVYHDGYLGKKYLLTYIAE